MARLLIKKVLVWTNDTESKSFKVFLSMLSLLEYDIVETELWRNADVWCITGDKDIDMARKNYSSLLRLPSLISLGDMPEELAIIDHYSIKSPVRLKAVEQWLAEQILPVFAANTNSEVNELVSIDKTKTYQWMTQPFKLTSIPANCEHYKSEEVDKLCQFMQANWVEVDQLLNSTVDENIIWDILVKAEQSDNLIFGDVSEKGKAKSSGWRASVGQLFAR